MYLACGVLAINLVARFCTDHKISLFAGFLVTVMVCLFVAHHALEQVQAEQDD
jgi:hypothetical protein